MKQDSESPALSQANSNSSRDELDETSPDYPQGEQVVSWSPNDGNAKPDQRRERSKD